MGGDDSGAGLSIRLEQETAQKLQEYKDSLNEEQITQLIEQTKALKRYQEEPSPKEVLEMIPMLSREDIKRRFSHCIIR